VMSGSVVNASFFTLDVFNLPWIYQHTATSSVEEHMCVFSDHNRYSQKSISNWSKAWGRRNMSLRPAWAAWRIQGQARLHRKTLFQKSNTGKFQCVKIKHSSCERRNHKKN
jgi:hypothetical protein